MQALTDNAHDPAKFRRSVMEVALDYLAVGIDPAKSTICLQSHLPALAELALLYMNFVTVARLERNPTIKDEIRMRGFGRNVPAGFLCYGTERLRDMQRLIDAPNSDIFDVLAYVRFILAPSPAPTARMQRGQKVLADTRPKCEPSSTMC